MAHLPKETQVNGGNSRKHTYNQSESLKMGLTWKQRKRNLVKNVQTQFKLFFPESLVLTGTQVTARLGIPGKTWLKGLKKLKVSN